jgi:hypothetical protein
MLLRWRAPELALLLADRAVTAAQDDKMAVLQADHFAVFALNRLGRHGQAAHRLFPAIRDADTSPGLRHELHVELAHCAAALGEPAIALDAVRAVLAAGDDITPVLRGRALVAAAEASVMLGRDDLVTSMLNEADELYREDPSLDHDTALLLRAAARAADAGRYRSCGAAGNAEAKAREGRELLTGLADPEHDSGEVSARLMLELVLALLDRDAGEAATQEVRPLLRRPVRAAAAGAVGRLRLALATRVHLAEGRHDPALTLLADAVEGAQRHGVDAVLAECLEGLSHVHEARGEFVDALHCMRAARAAEGRHRRDVQAARSALLENCGTVRRDKARVVGQVAVLLGNAGTGCTGLDSGTDPLNAQGAVGVAAPQTTEPQTTEPDVAEVEVNSAEVAGVAAAEAEVAEMLEAAEAETLQLSAPTVMSAVADVAVAESGVPSESVDPPAAGEPVAENPSPVSQEPAVHSAESSTGLDSWQAGARHRRGAGTLVSVSDLLPASAFSSGRSGRRRAVEPAEDRADETFVAEEDRIGDGGGEDASAGPQGVADSLDGSWATVVEDATDDDATDAVPSEATENLPPTQGESVVSGPPPAPTPRVPEWDPEDEDPENEDPEDEDPEDEGTGNEDLDDEDSAWAQEPPRMGLGDLLTEALAAYQGSRDAHADLRPTGMGGAPAADAETSRDLPRYRVLGTRWAAGLTLAAQPVDGDEPAVAVTNPLLRLPDLTVEPRWVPPGAPRRSAAGN